MSRPYARALPVALALLLAACAQRPGVPESSGLMDVTDRPAERALLAGIRAYDDAQYPQAERQLQQALGLGLATGRDKAAAHKYLAFIFCSSNRMTECEAQFRSARVADPAFALSRSEAGHPLWGPVYQRLR